MRFNSFIISESSSFGTQEINAIHRDCKKYFAGIKFGQKLFRGLEDELTYGFGIKTVRTDRRPMDTPGEVHDILDHLFLKKFGIRARRDTVFCTTTLWQAEEYGIPYYFFPIGDFRMIFSKDVMDLTAELRDKDILTMDYSTGKRIFNVIIDDESLQKELEKFVNKYEMTADPGRAFASPGEVMVKCDKYYLVDVDIIDKHYHEMFKDTKR